MSEITAEKTDNIAELAWEIVENTGASLFLTGKAGTGKTTFLNRLRERSRKRMVVLAPTGIAAINAGGVTIHSFFQLPFSPFVPGHSAVGGERRFKLTKTKLSIIRSLDLLVIDEISMVRADLLDAIDSELRRIRRDQRPFGGVQLLLIGDLQQLPPVLKDTEAQLLAPHYVSPYFFDSIALQKVPYRMIELTKVYRQSNLEFVSMLNDIRGGAPSSDTLRRLNERCDPAFHPKDEEGYVILTTHNEQARRINAERLGKLRTAPQAFSATVDGIFPESSFPADFSLELKVGAQVMFIKNDSSGERRYYNGMIGAVAEIDSDAVYVKVPGQVELIKVTQETWDNNRYELDPQNGEIKEVREGSFSQFPLRLAWAITIHKSQGLTFSRVIIDASRSFAHGQTYVALSRCRSLEGLVLMSPLSASAVISDLRVHQYSLDSLARAIDPEILEQLRTEYRLVCLDEIFNLESMRNTLDQYKRAVSEGLGGLFPVTVSNFVHYLDEKREPWRRLFYQFGSQYRSLIAAGDERQLEERLKAASRYYLGQIDELQQKIEQIPTSHDNKEMKKRLQSLRADVTELLGQRTDLLQAVAENGFSIESFLKARSKGIVEEHISSSAPKSNQSGTVRRGTSRVGTSSRSKDAGERIKEKAQKEPPKGRSLRRTAPVASADVLHPHVYDALRRWRSSKADELDVLAFAVLTDKTMLRIANDLPETTLDLVSIPGIGPKKLNAFGDEILQVVKKSSKED